MASLHPRHLLDTVQNISFSGGRNNTDDETTSRDNNFDSNMVIILAVLLFALIGALAINSIVRCALRYRRNRLSMAAETPGEAAARLAATGLKKRALRQIPTAVIGGANSSGMSITPGTECAICLGDFVDGEKVRVLPKCNHGFHVKCIDTWLMSRSSCPNCRHSLLEQPAASDGATQPPPGNRNGQQDHLVIALTM